MTWAMVTDHAAITVGVAANLITIVVGIRKLNRKIHNHNHLEGDD